MKLVQFGAERGSFAKLAESRDVQALKMTLAPGDESTDSPDNEHRWSEQWLFVLAGRGQVRIGKTKGRLHSYPLRKGSLLLVEKGELHRIRNTGRTRLVTLNFYVPPAYDQSGDPLPPNKRRGARRTTG
ncbi:MAG: cupin domain-containing protein [Planctomycetaceae bacterium]|nr:cupin domain-containing protein [Planctomycetaceae bacterium]